VNIRPSGPIFDGPPPPSSPSQGAHVSRTAVQISHNVCYYLHKYARPNFSLRKKAPCQGGMREGPAQIALRGNVGYANCRTTGGKEPGTGAWKQILSNLKIAGEPTISAHKGDQQHFHSKRVYITSPCPSWPQINSFLKQKDYRWVNFRCGTLQLGHRA
jgi:hypothetical protein